jgi:hypothetical protein
LLVEKFWKADFNEFSYVNWQREEWSIHSALVSVDQLETAAGGVPSTHCLEPEVGWGLDDGFGFDDQFEHGTIQAAPLILAIPHPVTNELVVAVSREFIVYHALHNHNSIEYSHPIDKIVVARAEIDTHDFYDPTASVTVHRDYLRDFLAATRRTSFCLGVTSILIQPHTASDSHIEQQTVIIGMDSRASLRRQ